VLALSRGHWIVCALKRTLEKKSDEYARARAFACVCVYVCVREMSILVCMFEKESL